MFDTNNGASTRFFDKMAECCCSMPVEERKSKRMAFAEEFNTE
jgi:hypothetical protein